MDENASGRGSVFETNDSLEAVSVFRAWKNIFFMILLACLLVTQAAFWLINLKIVEVPGVAATAAIHSQARSFCLSASRICWKITRAFGLLPFRAV